MNQRLQDVRPSWLTLLQNYIFTSTWSWSSHAGSMNPSDVSIYINRANSWRHQYSTYSTDQLCFCLWSHHNSVYATATRLVTAQKNMLQHVYNELNGCKKKKKKVWRAAGTVTESAGNMSKVYTAYTMRMARAIGQRQKWKKQLTAQMTVWERLHTQYLDWTLRDVQKHISYWSGIEFNHVVLASCSQDAKMLIHLPDYHHWDYQQVAKWCFNGLVLGQLHWKATNWHILQFWQLNIQYHWRLHVCMTRKYFVTLQQHVEKWKT